jgi:hypothetical protein
MKLFYKILFIFLGKGLFSLPLHNSGRITSILTHINTFISELVFSFGERHKEFQMTLTNGLETREVITLTNVWRRGIANGNE